MKSPIKCGAATSVCTALVRLIDRRAIGIKPHEYPNHGRTGQRRVMRTERRLPPGATAWRLLAASGCLSVSLAAQAQLAVERAPWSLTVEGHANVVAGRSSSKDGGGAGSATRADAGLRLLGLRRLESGTSIGARLEALTSPEDRFEAGERSALALGDWGRLELGKRRGLPVTITGYPPNNFTFTGAEFSVSSGRGLDPGGTLATAFLSPTLAQRIDAVSSLGFATTLFNDQSGKLIYIAPKTRGWQVGASYAPRAEQQNGRFGNIAQAGLTREIYTG
ncbi:MAG: porin, partial [Burkholderiales bacterium]